MQEQQPTTPATTPAITTTTESPPLPAPVPAAPVVRKARGGRILNYALGGALVLAIAGVAFAVGRVTAPPTVSAGRATARGAASHRPAASRAKIAASTP